MEKILLAIGHRELEEYLEVKLSREFVFVGTTVYREGVIRAIGQKAPNIVIIRETLSGNENIMSIIYHIRTNYPNVRIIFLAGNREVGDELLATLVNYGVYDILHGESIPAKKIVSLIRRKNTYKDVKHLQPVPILDENRNKMMFEAPESEGGGVEVVEVIKEIYIGDKDDKEKPHKTNDDIYEDTNEDDDIFIDEDKVKDDGDNLVINQKNEDVEIKRNSVKDTHKKPSFKISVPKPRPKPKPSEKKNNENVSVVANERIITFIGGKNGVGATTLAINTAFELASKGKKVIYVEFNENYPAVSYWYELGYTTEGIDTFMEYLDRKEYARTNNTIIKSSEIKKVETPMKKNYKKFPDTLDFLFFSKEYLSKLKDRVDYNNSKELYMYLMYQMGYDFVIIDVSSDVSNEATINGLIFSNKVFSVVTQDVSSIGYYLFSLNDLEKKGININAKNHYIVNKFVQSSLGEKEIKDWVGAKQLLTMSDFSRDFIDSNFKGIPAILNSKNVDLASSINKIVSVILNK